MTVFANDIVWIFLTAAMTVLVGILANLLSADGFQFGPLATWVSGAASTCAVIVALRGHRKTEDQRESDKADKHRSSAYQALLKLVELARAAHYARFRLRTNITNLSVEIQDENYDLFDIAPFRVVVSKGISFLKDDEENLFVRLNKVDALLQLNKAFQDYKVLLEAFQRHADLHDKFIELAEDPIPMATGAAASFDYKKPAVIKLAISKSGIISIALRLADQALNAVILAVPEALEVLDQYMPDRAVGVDTEFLKAEAKLPIRPIIENDKAKKDKNAL